MLSYPISLCSTQASFVANLKQVAPGLRPTYVEELTPETDPAASLEALASAGLPEGRVLVVAHLPLLGLISHRLTGEDPGFHPGMFVEIELSSDRSSGHIVRRVGADDLLGP